MGIFNFKKKQAVELRKSGKEQLLDDLLSKNGRKVKEIVYGVYDNSQASLFVKLNDFFIDHYPIPAKDKAYFYHLLGVLIDGGVPIAQGLNILAYRTENEHFQRVLFSLAHMIKAGSTLSSAMARFADVFSESEMGVIKSGEAIGQLDKVLFKLSQQLDKANALRMKLWTASIYPIAVFVILTLVIVGMSLWLLPALMDSFVKLNVKIEDLPITTRGMIALRSVLVNYLWALVLGVLIVVVAVKSYIDSDNGRFWWHYYLLKIPVLGTLIRKVNVLDFVDKFGLLMESGLSVIPTLKIIATSTKNEIYALHLWRVIGDVETGMSIADSLAKAPFLFPDDVTALLKIGERSATIANLSQKISKQYAKEISHTIKKLTALFEPVMIVVVGIFVAVLALSIMGPIFNLTQSF